MWIPVCVGDKTFLLKKESKDDCHKIYVSDLVNIWKEELISNILVKRCEKMNPLVTGKPEALIQRVLSSLDSQQSQINIVISDCRQFATLTTNTKVAGVVFTYEFNLQLMGSEHFYKEITLPLLLCVHQLQSRETMLKDLSMKKDQEIAEYKIMGAQLFRKNIETRPFQEAEYEQLCSQIAFPDDIVDCPGRLLSGSLRTLLADTCRKLQIEPHSTERHDSRDVVAEHTEAAKIEPVVKEETCASVSEVVTPKKQKQDVKPKKKIKRPVLTL